MHRSRRWSPRLLATMSLAGCWAIFLAPALFPTNVLLERDLLQTALPWREFMVERLRAGHLPQWYPLDGLGAPFLAQIVTAVFHPETLLYFLFQPVVALKWNILLAYGFGLAGMYRAARAFGTSRAAGVTAAIALAFGGYAQGISSNQPYLVGLATLPWVLWAALRVGARQRWRDAAVLAVAWALVLLGGDAQSFVLVPLLLLVALVEAGWHRRTVLLLVFSGLLATLVAAVSLVPALASLPDAARSSWHGGGNLGIAWALHPRRLLELVIPGFVPPDWSGSTGVLLLGRRPGTWSDSLFAGGIALVLAGSGVSRRRGSLALTGLGLLATWLALGDLGHLLPLAARLIPPLGMFRFPEKYLALFWIALSVLVALGVDRIRDEPKQFVGPAVGGALFCGALALTAASGWLVDVLSGGQHLQPDFAGALKQAWSHGANTTAAVLACFAVVLWVLPRRSAFIAVIPALAFLELWMGNGRVIKLAPIEAVTSRTEFAATILAAAPPHGPAPRVRTVAPMLHVSAQDSAAGELRALYMREVALPDAGALDGVPAMGAALPGLGARDSLVLPPLTYERGPFDGLLNGCFMVDQPKPEQTVVASSRVFNLVLAREPCRPRAYLADATPVSGAHAALEALRRGLATHQVVWEGGPAITDAAGQVSWVTDDPDHLVLMVDARKPSALAINDAARQGWSALVDGHPAPIHFTNVAVRGIEVKAGRHRVELRYQTPGLKPGMLLSLIGLLLTAASVAGHRWKR